MKYLDRLDSVFASTTPYALTTLRTWVGLAMMWYSHGYLFSSGGLTSFTNYAISLEIPLASFLAPVAKVFEFVGGAMILAGFYGRIAAMFITVVMMVAVIYAHHFDIFTEGGISFNLLIMNIILMLGGTGKFSIRDFPRRGNIHINNADI